MAIKPMNLVFASALIVGQALALQVTPSSPCAAKCLENPNENVTSASPSNTYGSDIVCIDADYTNTQVGQKYEDCVSCLQRSPAQSQDAGNDQEWFLYNLRYTLDTCLFAFANASDAQTQPCALDSSCGPLHAALSNGNFIPSNESEYSYCTADQNAIRGSALDDCVACLRTTSDQTYLANFLAALDAGCNQQPVPGVIIGLEGVVFSSIPINGTYPGFNQTAIATGSSHKKNGLSPSAIIGIVIGTVAFLVLATSILFVCFKKQRASRQLKALRSPLDSRFGAANITAPTDGAYGNPYSREINQAVQPFDPTSLSKKELNVLSEARSVLAKHKSISPRNGQYPVGTQDTHVHMANELPAFTGAAMPAHQAYIPPEDALSLASPASSANTENTYKMSSYAPSRTSPKYHHHPNSTSPKYIPRPSSTSPRNFSTPLLAPQPAQPSPRINQIAEDEASAGFEPRYSEQHPSPQPPSRSFSTEGGHRPIRGPTPTNTQISQSEEGTPRTYIAPPHSAAHSTQSEGHGRSPGISSGWTRATQALGIGNANATSTAAAPIQISGPILQHSGRLDFLNADKERKMREKKEQLRLDLSRRQREEEEPDSANSDELWPGSY